MDSSQIRKVHSQPNLTTGHYLGLRGNNQFSGGEKKCQCLFNTKAKVVGKSYVPLAFAQGGTIEESDQTPLKENETFKNSII